MTQCLLHPSYINIPYAQSIVRECLLHPCIYKYTIYISVRDSVYYIHAYINIPTTQSIVRDTVFSYKILTLCYVKWEHNPN